MCAGEAVPSQDLLKILCRCLHASFPPDTEETDLVAEAPVDARQLDGSAITADAIVSALIEEAGYRKDGGPRIGFGR